jgi:hypothetical protein
MGRIANTALGLAALCSFLLLFHNYGIPWLPAERLRIPAEKIRPFPGEKSFAYVYDYDGSEPDQRFKQRSALELFENNTRLRSRLSLDEEVRAAGGERWSHEPGRIVFASTDNSDPRTNGRTYTLLAPRCYTRNFGYAAALVFLGSVLGLIALNRRREPLPPLPASPPSSAWRRHVLGASALLLAGLYCNTGTLAPYGNTLFGHVDPRTGYLYNADHVHFKVLFDFVNGADFQVWNKALFLRRILFDVAAWPFMRIAGFEVGGAIASLVFNVLGLVAALHLLRRRIGERGAIFAGWLLALYPGAMYWGGLPYPHALIAPLSTLLMIALIDLPAARGRTLIGLSLAMGFAYLAYDFAVFFLPASALLLAWHRRPGALVTSVALQSLPPALWLLFLSRGLGQPLDNSNTMVYHVILDSYRHIRDVAAWWAYASDFPNVGLDVWFGANFIFLPALFLIVLALNPVTSRIRLSRPEIALLAVTLGLFLFNNLAPDYYGAAWVMRGTWIARLYQPVFPALVLFTARWWQHLPPLTLVRRAVVWTILAGVFIGNALIVFGPILANPLRLSETAFYRFYNHTDMHGIYEDRLREFGRRPIGFPRPQP